MSRERSAGLVVFRERGGRREYLLVQSRRHGAWGFPKGHVRPGETDLAAARRETAEETGLADLEVVPGFVRALRYELPGSGIEKEAVYLPARAPDEAGPAGALDPEVAETVWVSLAEALRLLTFAEARELLRALDEFLK